MKINNKYIRGKEERTVPLAINSKTSTKALENGYKNGILKKYVIFTGFKRFSRAYSNVSRLIKSYLTVIAITAMAYKNIGIGPVERKSG
jgi:hypothetical protein